MIAVIINTSSALMTTARRSVQDRVKLKPRLYQELVRSTTQRRVWLIGITVPLGWIRHSQPRSVSSLRVTVES